MTRALPPPASYVPDCTGDAGRLVARACDVLDGVRLAARRVQS